MGKYSDKILGQPQQDQPTSPPKKKYSEMILGGGFKQPKEYVENPQYEDTEETSTITGKPIQKTADNTWYKPADFSTLMKAGFVDNNDSRIDLFSKARGISKEKYEIKDGKIWFEGKDGKMYPETPKEITSLLKKVAAELPSELPADVGAAAGAISPVPGGSAIGAAGGELIRKEIGKRFFGDVQSVPDYLIDMGVNAALGGIDAYAANLLANSLSTQKIKKATGGKLTSALSDVVGDISPAQRQKGLMVKSKADSIGVDVLPHQAMDDPTLTGYYKLLRDSPKTAREVRANDQRLDEQVKKAGEDLLKKISTRETDPFEVGKELSDVGQDIVDRMKSVRSEATRPIYEKANESINVDMQPALETIAGLKDTLKPGMKAHKQLSRIEEMLTRTVETPEGKNIKVPENRLSIIDSVKKEIDAVLGGPDAPAINGDMKRRMMEVKETLTQQADAASPDYKIARALYGSASPKIEGVEKGIIGNLKRLESEGATEKAVNNIFQSYRSIKQAKKYIEKENPELWADTVAEYFRQGLEKSSKFAQGGDVINRPGKYAAKMWQLEDQSKMKAALKGMDDGAGNDLYKTMEDFFDVMRSASIGHGKESATQPRFKMERDLQGAIGEIPYASANIRYTMANFLLNSRKTKTFDKNSKKLLELMQTPEGVDLIAKAKGYGPKTEQGIRAATTLLLMATETNTDDISEAASHVINK